MVHTSTSPVTASTQFNNRQQPVVLWPSKYKTGDAFYPYDAAKN